MPIRAVVLSTALLLAVPAHAQQAADTTLVELTFWESVRQGNTAEDYRAYLEQYPQGKFAVLARNRLAAMSKPAAPPVPAPAASRPAAASAAPVAALPQDERLPRIGDSWSYRFLPRGSFSGGVKTYAVTVAAASATAVRERTVVDGAPPVESEHSAGSYVAPAGALSLFSPYLAAFTSLAPNARLSIDNRDARTCAPAWSCSLTGRVLGREVVTVPAGTFEAIKVHVEQNWVSPSQTNDRGEFGGRILTVWYAPQIKRAVKYSSRGVPSRLIDTQFELELTSYKLN